MENRKIRKNKTNALRRAARAVVCALLAGALAVGLSACKSGSGTNGKTPAPADITAKVQQQVKFDEMEEITAQRLSRFYTVDSSAVSQMSLYVSTSLASSDELAVFVGKSGSDAAKIKTAVQARIQKRNADFNGYNAAQYAKLQKSVLEVRGNYVFFAVCSDPAKAKSAFDSFFA